MLARGQTQQNLVERDPCTLFGHRHPNRTTPDWCDAAQVTIDILPDDILLCMFYVYVNGLNQREEWHTLVHVCRRWRTLVFGSPHHLDVRLFCSNRTPVLAKLDIWPAIPIVLRQYERSFYQGRKFHNLIAAIKHNDRICEIDFGSHFGAWYMEDILSEMQVPFPELTDLKLNLDGRNITGVLPDSFLGRSAPRLQHLELQGFSFRGLPNLLLSTTNLVSLELRRIPPSWYISPDTMVSHLSFLTRLKSLTLEFDFALSHPDRESRHSPPKRTLLSALARLKFKGANEYAEDLLTRINAPRLNDLDIIVFDETVFDISDLFKLISRHVSKFRASDKARVAFSHEQITATLSLPAPGYERLTLGILFYEFPGHLSSFIQLCGPLLPAFAMVERLYIHHGCDWSGRWESGVYKLLWLQLLQFFPDAKDLYVFEEFTTCIVPALNKLVGERTTEVLPALQNIFLHEYDELSGLTDIKAFIAARELSGRPVAICRWNAAQWDV